MIGYLPVKQVGVNPWGTLCVDLIKPYTIHRKEIKPRADVVSNVVETIWLTTYPYPTQVVLDIGAEFMAQFTEIIASDYGIKKKLITPRSP
eukprot:12526209-Ditylum_brightwellii.AAC.1